MAPTPGEATREALLDAALRVLARDGVGAFAQPQVAREAGFRQSHLTYHFPKKRDLLEAVMARFLDGMAARIRAARDRDLPSALRELHDLVTDPPHMRMFAGLVVEAEADDDLREALRAGMGRFEAALADSLGWAAGDPRMPQLLALLWGLGLRRLVDRAPLPAPELDRLLHPFETRSPRRTP